MREVHRRQFEFGQVPVEKIWIDPKSRDDIPAVLKGLQHIWSDEALRARCDSFVVETDVHYPTDVSLLWDALRCLLRKQGGQRHVISYTYRYHAIHVVMALNIRNAETERLAAELALLTGQTKTEAVTDAIRNHLERLRREQSGRTLADELDEIGRQCAKLPARDGRLADEILGYDEHGLPR